MFSSRRACPECGYSIEELAPRMFSFNNPLGACAECLGIGATLHADPDRIVPDKDKPIGRAISVWGLTPTSGALDRFGTAFGYNPRRPIRELPEKGWKALMYGTDRSVGLVGHGAGEWWGSGWLREGLGRGGRTPLEADEEREREGVLHGIPRLQALPQPAEASGSSPASSRSRSRAARSRTSRR